MNNTNISEEIFYEVTSGGFINSYFMQTKNCQEAFSSYIDVCNKYGKGKLREIVRTKTSIQSTLLSFYNE